MSKLKGFTKGKLVSKPETQLDTLMILNHSRPIMNSVKPGLQKSKSKTI
ncbi:hypothetical protein [Peribacillus butanolivorans]